MIWGFVFPPSPISEKFTQQNNEVEEEEGEEEERRRRRRRIKRLRKKV